jgi:hypothetical protein
MEDVMTKELFAVLMAGTLLIPLMTLAGSQDATTGFAGAQTEAAATNRQLLQLPPVPHLGAVPWLNSGQPWKAPKSDTLFGPKLDTLGPFLLRPAFSDLQATMLKRPDSQTHTE